MQPIRVKVKFRKIAVDYYRWICYSQYGPIREYFIYRRSGSDSNDFKWGYSIDDSPQGECKTLREAFKSATDRAIEDVGYLIEKGFNIMTFTEYKYFKCRMDILRISRLPFKHLYE